MITTKRPIWVWITTIIAVVFGVMTIKSGGSVLFIDGEARHAAGNYVNFEPLAKLSKVANILAI